MVWLDRLMRPVSLDTRSRMWNEAEDQYQNQKYALALPRFENIARVDTERLRQAWLRIGNIHHRSDRVALAMEAYRKASDAEVEPASAEEQDAHRKALWNLTLLSVDQAEAALKQLQAVSTVSGTGAPPVRGKSRTDRKADPVHNASTEPWQRRMHAVRSWLGRQVDAQDSSSAPPAGM